MAKTVRLKVEREPSKKYNIEKQIGLIPREMSVADIIKHLDGSGVSRDQFYRDRRIKFGSVKSIPSDRLLVYCKVFECTVDDLVNHDVNAASIRSVLDAPASAHKTKRSKTGLK